MDFPEAAAAHNAAEIDAISAALVASHEANQRRLNRLLRAHPDIVAEADQEFASRPPALASCSLQHEVRTKPRSRSGHHQHILSVDN